MDNTGSLAMTISGTVISLLWIIVFFINHKKYKEIINTSAAKKLKLNEIFFIGFAFMKIFKINIRTDHFTKKRRLASELYGQEYAEFYTYLNTGAQITYAVTLFPISMLIAGASGSVGFAAVGSGASLLMLFFIDEEVKKNVLHKRYDMMCELPDIISRLALLVNAGMVLREAWERVAASSDTILCREMKRTSQDIRNGMVQTEAFMKFAYRCQTKEIRKFISSLNQNIQKGSSELVISLQAMADEQWEEKKNTVKKKANAVEQKLLLPMMMIFTAIILMIVVPVFTNMF